MRAFTTIAAALVLTGTVAAAQVGVPQQEQPQQPAPGTPQQQFPPTTQIPAPAPGTVAPAPGTVVPQQPGVPPPVVPPPLAPPAITASRAFLAKTGMIFQSVRPDRVIDFETVIGLLTDALKTSTDPTVQAQAKGWRVFKATEPGPNNTVTYVFLIDPAVPGADYGIGRVLADAYPDKIQEIWKLYTGSLAPGATLLNLTLIEGPTTPPPATTPAAPTTAAPAAPQRPGPPAAPPVAVSP
jgi:hypothetical protein